MGCTSGDLTVALLAHTSSVPNKWDADGEPPGATPGRDHPWRVPGEHPRESTGGSPGFLFVQM